LCRGCLRARRGPQRRPWAMAGRDDPGRSGARRVAALAIGDARCREPLSALRLHRSGAIHLSGALGSRLLRQLDLNLFADQTDFVGLDRIDAGRRRGRPGLDVEAAGVQRALDLAAVEPTVRQFGVGVGAHVIGRVKSSIEVVEGDLAPADDDADNLVLREVGARGDRDPALVAHALPPPEPNALNAMIVKVSRMPSRACTFSVTKCPISVLSGRWHFMIRSYWPEIE